MSRPRCCRRVSGLPACRLFKPMGLPASSLGEVAMSLDEYEAIRLADHEGLYQEQAAERMGVSRATFGRTLEAARRKVAQALVLGLVLRIEVTQAEAEDLSPLLPAVRRFLCSGCGHQWQESFGTGRPPACPACKGQDFHRSGCAGRSACTP